MRDSTVELFNFLRSTSSFKADIKGIPVKYFISSKYSNLILKEKVK